MHPRAVLLALDSRERSYRHELLPGYQGQRPPFPSDLTEQLDALPQLAEAFGFVAAKVSPFEADDLLASGVEQELAAGGSAVTMTSDRDAYQLVGDRSSVLVPSQGAASRPSWSTRQGVRERYGIEPSQVPDLIALRGDPSDAIPGARGHRRRDRRRPAATLRHARGRDRARARADPEAAGVRCSAPPTICAATARSRRCAATCRCPELPDADLDAERAAAWAETRGLGALSRRLRARAVDSVRCDPTRS